MVWVAGVVDDHLTNREVYELMKFPYSSGPLGNPDDTIDVDGMYYVFLEPTNQLIMQGGMSSQFPAISLQNIDSLP